MSNKKQMLYTPEGYKVLTDELDYLKTVRREEIKEAIAVAKGFGDLSENAEYDEARNDQAKTEARIKELEELVANAVIVDETKIDNSIVSLGSVVTVYDVEEDEEIKYSIVGSNEANPMEHKISDQSPIGKALMGAKAGDTVTVESPSGYVIASAALLFILPIVIAALFYGAVYMVYPEYAPIGALCGVILCYAVIFLIEKITKKKKILM